MLLSFDRVDNFVNKQTRLGSNVRWDGWTMVFFTPSKRAVYSPSGVFREGEYGFETRIAPADDGKWRVPHKFVNHASRGRPKNIT